jgi:hypothetical protein
MLINTGGPHLTLAALSPTVRCARLPLLVTSMIGALLIPQHGLAQSALSVCQVLDRTEGEVGIVAVRGELVVGPEQSFIRPYKCLQVSSTKYHNLDDAIWVAKPGSFWAENTVLEVDQPSIALLESAVKKHGMDETRVLLVTIVGKFESRPQRLIAQNRFIGYGHLGGFRAQLVYQSVRDIVIVQRDETKSR